MSNSRILHIESDGVVILKNIKFTNANDGALFVTPAVWDYDYQIWYIDCDLKIDECTFINNKGGAINGPTDGDIIITNSTFTNNQAKYGGAINTYANLDITNCKFTGNFANYYGGAINSELSSDARSGKEIKVLCINKCTFTKNTAEDGGAISSERILLVQNSIFKDNTATKNGQYYASSIAAKGESIKLVKCNFSGYESKEIVCINGKITTTNCLFKTPIKLTPKLTAKKATFKVKTKTKKYSVILKTNKNKAMKKVKLYLKVKGKTYTAKTNSNGKATFKITKLTKKGTYNAVITFKGNNNYKKVTKTVKFKVK